MSSCHGSIEERFRATAGHLAMSFPQWASGKVRAPAVFGQPNLEMQDTRQLKS